MPPLHETARFWITALTALLALGFSILSLYLRMRDRKPRLVISASIQIAPLPLGRDDIGGLVNVAVPVLKIHFSNPSERAIYVRDADLVAERAIKIPLKQFNALYGGLKTPFKVNPRGGHDMTVRGNFLHEELESYVIEDRKLKVWVEAEDELGKLYKSRKIRISLHDLKETPMPEPME